MLFKALRFSLVTDKLILTSSDALQALDLGVDDDDNVGEVRSTTYKVEPTTMLIASTSSS